MQITIPKYKEIPGQFYPLLQWAKHINKTYMYFNLLLIISAADKKKLTKNKYTFFNLSFHIYSVKIIGMWSNRWALITGQLQTTVLQYWLFHQSSCRSYAPTKQGFVSLKVTHMVSKVALLQPAQLEIIATSSRKNSYSRQGGSLEGSNVTV